jgi:acyl-CoA synthetase (AMP-forming)/AMP-acid ligase II
MAPAWPLRGGPAEVAARYVREGFWTDDTLGAVLAGALSTHPERVFRVRSQRRPFVGTLGGLHDLALRVAGGLRARGVGPGDVVAFQLPNWMEAAATFYATSFLGAVMVPIVHFYGPKEVGYILARSEAKAYVVADRFGHADYLALIEQVRPELPALETVAVVGDDVPAGTVPFAALLEGPPLDGPAPVDPTAPAVVAYTSGTTSEPKGVIHTHRTLLCEMRQLGAAQAKGAGPSLWGLPVTHASGMLGALLLPVVKDQPVHLIDVWDPGVILAAMLEDQLGSGSGATFFLTSLLDHPDIGPEHLRLMRHIGLGGSSIPAAVTERATALGLVVSRMYGSTEHPSTTASPYEDPVDKRVHTDGKPLPGVELRLVDDDDRDVAPGQPGEILSRGPDCCMGYTDPALTARAFTADGWYRTEDVGVLDANGYLTIVDRKKDIIIRGGENVSALEVEELLTRMPGVAEVAVVAAPDARLGEHACAFVRALPGAAPPGLDAIRDHLAGAGLARPKWPEEVRVVDDFPRTASGKVQKFVLRDELRREAVAGAGTGAATAGSGP